MRRGIVIAALLLLTGCAVGRISPTDMHGFALGGGARLERCTTTTTLGLNRCLVSPPAQTCTTIAGGRLSAGAWDFLGAALSALAAYFTAGAAGVL